MMKLKPTTEEERAQIAQDKPPPGFAMLKIQAKCVADDDTLIQHIESALARGLKEFADSPAHNGECVLVGSGPSVREYVPEIRKHKQKGHLIIAVKSAHDFLIEKGVVPHIALGVDPQAKIKSAFSRKRKEVTYFLASQVHPEVFDYLSDQRVVLWHLFTGKEKEKELLKNKLKVGGGSTSGMRGLTVAYLMGFRKLHLYGYDSCIRTDLLKVTGEKVKGIEEWMDKAREAIGNRPVEELFQWLTHNHGREVPILRLHVEGKDFWADKAMAAQATEFEMMLNVLQGAQVKAYGEGLIQHLVQTGAKAGRPDCKLARDSFSPVPLDPLQKSMYEAQLCLKSSSATTAENQLRHTSQHIPSLGAQASP
jgi:uncharacterized Rossmann fold enzyme